MTTPRKTNWRREEERATAQYINRFGTSGEWNFHGVRMAAFASGFRAAIRAMRRSVTPPKKASK